MKKLLLTLIIAFIYTSFLFSQNGDISKEMDSPNGNYNLFQYCEVGTVKHPFKAKTYGVIHNGNKESEYWVSITDINTGEKLEFTDDINLLNFMGGKGWKVNNWYTDNQGQKRFLLERKILTTKQ